MKHFWRKPCVFVVLGMIAAIHAGHTQVLANAAQERAAARRFLAHRGMTPRQSTDGIATPAYAHSFEKARAARGAMRPASKHANATDSPATLPPSLNTTWSSVGPQQVLTAAYGPVTGRVTSIAVDPSDLTGNTVYVGTTGGGVWKSINAAASQSSVQFKPITDDVTDNAQGSLSIGALTVQPGGTGVVLAGTGDPNDALDSYYGSGILRSTDHGVTWSTINEADIQDPSGASPVSFFGEGFSAFAWSTAAPNLVVAALTDSYDGTTVNAHQPNSVDGLYYSTDAGATWRMSTITDGPHMVFQSPAATSSNGQGNAVTSVVWNPFRQAFFAAVRYHGYYTSPDGITWTRLANQPSPRLSSSFCPNYGAGSGSLSCPILRGALAVQPVTGDMFAFTVDNNLTDQGIWQDVCAGSSGSCSTGPTVLFNRQIPDTSLQDGSGKITQGDYNLWIAAVPANADTLLYAGTIDIFKRALAATNVPWRNATNVYTCAAAQVAPAQHAVAIAPLSGLLYFGNDGGLWRTSDGIAQQQPACSADDATHFTNLNSSLGSIADVTNIAQASGSDTTLVAALSVNGTASTETAQGAWPQLLDGLGWAVEIDPSNPQNWYISSGLGVSISFCGSGGACTPSSFSDLPTIGDAQTGSDGEYLGEPAVWMLNPQDTTKMLVGTCRVWQGDVDGTHWAAISHVLDLGNDPDCTLGAGQIQSLAASGTINTTGTPQQILYAGMEGTSRDGNPIPDGGLIAGHVFTATVAAGQSSPAAWIDLFTSRVVNGFSNSGQFNPGGFGISSIAVDPHDPSGQTVYVAIQGFSGNGISEPVVYRSTNQGNSWTNITANLPISPVNALIVDPGDANTLYLASDAGVYATTTVATCATSGQCWQLYGEGLPDAPVTTLVTNGAVNDSLLLAGTYGRGIYQMRLASYVASQANPNTSVSFSPASFTFAALQVGVTSLPQTTTVTNMGSAPLVITTVATTGDFSVGTDNCSGTTVAQGASCSVAVVFSPQSQGARTGTLSVSGNLPNGSATASLSGIGYAFSLNPAQVNFSATQVNTTTTAQTVTVTDVGATTVGLSSVSVTGPFTEQDNCAGATIQVHGSCTIQIVFAPASQGPLTGTLTVTDNAAGTQLTVALSGTAYLSGQLVLNPQQLNFASTVVGTTSPSQTILSTNSGSTSLSIATAKAGGDFSITQDNCSGVTIAAGAGCTVSVDFTPSATGTLNSALVFIAGTPSFQATAGLTGIGVPPGKLYLAPLNLNYGGVSLGTTSSPQYVTITNTGGSVLTLGPPAVSSGDYQIQGNSCTATLAADVGCTIGIVFAPTKSGPANGSFSITAGGSTMTTTLSGSGLAPATDIVSPASLAFVPQAVGSVSPVQYITVTNNGDQALTSVTAVSSSSNFLVQACVTVVAHATCSIGINFAPSSPGQVAGLITISDSLHNGASALTVTVSGTGIAPAGSVSLTPASLDFGAEGLPLTPPLVATQSATLTNNGSTVLTNLLFTTTGPFTVATGTCGVTLAIGDSCSPIVTFTPTQTGFQTGTLTVTGTNLAQPLSTTLNGGGLNFTMSVISAASATVVTGTTANYQVSILPVGASSGMLALACSISPALPAGSSCLLNPQSSVQLTSGASSSVAVAVTTPALPITSSTVVSHHTGWFLAAILPIFGLRLRSGRRFCILAALCILLTCGGLTGCGLTTSGGSKSSTNGTGTNGGGTGASSADYTITITASAPGIQQSAAVTLVLEQ